LRSEALDLRVLLDCGATPVRSRTSGGGPALRAPDIAALLTASASSARPSSSSSAWPVVDAILLSSPAAALALPLLYRAAAEAQEAAATGAGGGGSTASPSAPSSPPALPLHTYATEACLEIAEHWVAELLDAERRAGAAAAAISGRGGGAAPGEPDTRPPTLTTPLFSARDAQRALACVRPVRLGERLTLPGGGRVVAEALPASGARLGVAAWRLRLGATGRLLYLGPCASSLKGHAAPLDLGKALEGAQAMVLGPGAVAVAAADGDEAEDDEDGGSTEGPRPPLLEQSLRAAVDPADARHAAAVHRAARAALGAVVDARREAAEAAGAAAAAATVAVDPTGAAFDFLEALDHEARLLLARRQGAEGNGGEEKGEERDKEEEEDEDEEDEEEEEGQLRTARRRHPRQQPPLARVLYRGPVAEASLALASSAAEFLSPGRLSRVVRRAAAPFAHGRMLVARREGGEGGNGDDNDGARRGRVVELRLGTSDTVAADIVLVPAARMLAAEGDAAAEGRVLIRLGTAAEAVAADDDAPPLRVTVPLPGERGLPAHQLAKALFSMPIPPVAVTVGSNAEAQALQQALSAAAAGTAASPALVCVAATAAPVALPPLPSPLFEAWLSGSLAARTVLAPLPRPPGAPAMSAARLPRVRLSNGGGGGAWRVDAADGDGKAEQQQQQERDEAAVVAALGREGYEVVERRQEQEEEESKGEEEEECEARRFVLVLRVRPAAVADAAPPPSPEAEVRLALSKAGALTSVVVLSDDATLRERLRAICVAV
jgi:hypothetical protein